ncbi:hypothetical protein SAMN05216276_100250 [Streptosporangium subroseum]|uniref:Uncharacterized protein n=1 Tax=Streptosporangium subroseum TaxID=106412 RepID=A0A239AN93_9ACTN|nr:DUF6461 domain-containing protein [Streptosporangium subroseum]SNR97115.1 hypothetical protein SAMN05216276_100250 [Streptosporangium subroseum]
MDAEVLAYYGRLVEETLTVPLCITWVEDLPATDVLAAAGRREDGVGSRTYAETVQAAYDAIPVHAGAALAGPLGEWTVLVEPNGFQGSRPDVLTGLSRRGRALSVFWNANGDGQLVYAEHGRLLTVLDLFDPEELEELEELPPALSAWAELAEQDDPRVAGLALGEAVTHRRLDARWLAGEHLSAILDASQDTVDTLAADQDRIDHLAYLAGDPRVADLIADPAPGRIREVAALIAETACELTGLDVPLARRVMTSLAQTPGPAVLAELRDEVRHLSEDLLTQYPGADAPPSTIERWHAPFRALKVLEAALGDDAKTAAQDAIWRIGTLRLGDHGGRRVGSLMGVLEKMSAPT